MYFGLHSILRQGEYKVETHCQSHTHTPGSDEAPCQMDPSWMSPGNSLQLKIVFIVSRLPVHKPNHHSSLQDISRHRGSSLVNTTRFEMSPQGLLTICYLPIACKYLFHLYQIIILKMKDRPKIKNPCVHSVCLPSLEYNENNKILG